MPAHNRLTSRELHGTVRRHPRARHRLAVFTILLLCSGGSAAAAPTQPASRGNSPTERAEPAANQAPAKSATSRRGNKRATAGARPPVTVSVNLAFDDSFEKTQRPIAGVPVEIWTFAPRLLAWTWANAVTGRTNAKGRFTTTLPFKNRNVIYAVRVLPSNRSAACCSGFGSQVIELKRGGKPIHLKANKPGATVRFKHVFTGEWGSIFNALDVINHAGAFARRFETNVDSDRIGVARIGLAGSGPKDASWFDPVAFTMNLTPRTRWRDDVILHEYAHYLQAQIGSLAWIASSHNGCTPGFMFQIGGPPIGSGMRQMHAWLEGFADWFAEVAYWDKPAAFAPVKVHPGEYLETATCPESGPWPDGDRFEYHVAAFLWDMTDPASPTTEPFDQDGGNAQVAAIFRALDKELDTSAWPTVFDLTFQYFLDPATFPSHSALDNATANKVSYVILN